MRTDIFLFKIDLYFYKKSTHVGKYDPADDRPKLAILAANTGYRPMIDRDLDDNCGPIVYWLVILAPKSLPMISRESLPLGLFFKF